MPWMICERASESFAYEDHSVEVLREATQIVRTGLEMEEKSS